MTKVVQLDPIQGAGKRPLAAKLVKRRRLVHRARPLTQAQIDPSETRLARDGWVPAIIPDWVRAFGFVPNFQLLLPGDLILMRFLEPDRQISGLAQKVENAQLTAGFAGDEARWTHAAVYAGEQNVIEAGVRWGVCVRSLYDYIPTHIFRVRRDNNLSGEQRLALVLHAMTMLGTKYAIRHVPTIAIRLASGLWNPASHSNLSPACICSTVFSDAHFHAAGSPLVEISRKNVVTPAALSHTPSLTDVVVPWHKIPGTRKTLSLFWSMRSRRRSARCTAVDVAVS